MRWVNRKRLTAILLAVAVTVSAYPVLSRAATPSNTANDTDVGAEIAEIIQNAGKGSYMSNRFTGYYPDSKSNHLAAITPAFTRMAENTRIALYLNQESLAIRVLNKETGYIWSSNVEDFGEEKINDKWKAYINSGVTIEYYTIKSNGTADIKPTEESFLGSGRSTADITPLANGFRAAVVFGETQIGLTFEVTLNGTGLDIRMDDASIIESDSRRIVSVQFYPCLGATRPGAQTGYFLLPDGDGSLVNFEKLHKNVNANFQKRYYGTDNGIAPAGSNSNRTMPNPPTLQYNVYGVVHGVRDNAYMTEIESGASFAELLMYPGGVRTNFYIITNRFAYRQQYSYIISTGRQSTMITPERAVFDVHERVTMLSGAQADYSGIAVEYRTHLQQKGWLTDNAKSMDDIPITIFGIAAATNEGMFWNPSVPMTTLSDAETIVAELNGDGVQNIRFTYRFASKEAQTGKAGDRYKLAAGLGSLKELAGVAERMAENGNLFILYSSPSESSGKVAGLDTKADVIRKINKQYTVFTERTGAVNYKAYMLNASGIRKLMVSDAGKAADTGAAGVHFAVSQPVGSTFNQNELPQWREESIQSVGAALAEAKSVSGIEYMALEQMNTTPNYFASMDGMSYVGMSASLYSYVTDSIPFTAIVLRGSMELFGNSLNNAPNPAEMSLRMTEWGVYPAFEITEAESSRMLYSNIWWLVSTQYTNWRQEITTTYAAANGSLKHVTGENITNHTAVAPGVMRTTYANGVQIYINYTPNVYRDGTVTVQPMGSEVVLRD